MDLTYSIGQIAELSECAVQTVRHYEALRLLPTAPRSLGNQRRYGDDALKRLRFIRHARGLGFSLDDVRELLRMADHPNQHCEQIDCLAQQRLDDVTRRIAQLQALQGELTRMIQECSTGPVRSCYVLQVLNDASHEHARLDLTGP